MPKTKANGDPVRERLVTLVGFLKEFVARHRNRHDRSFCFILGAGASQQSEIPGGAGLAREWVEDLHRSEDFQSLPLEEWATASNLKIEGFDLSRVAEFYPQVYARRFGDREEDGYACLESKMEGKIPSFGYAVLAYVLSETPHKIVITTNFDNLVADALSIHSSTFPIVVGHDSLASYARVALRRPLIAKVHGSIGFSPKSKEGDLQCLSKEWCQALARICERYTPIVIGYDGNDGSLMGCLEGLPDGVPDTLYWCFHDPDQDPFGRVTSVPSRARDLVCKKKGRLVPIPGFDELMLLIHRELSRVDKDKVPNLYDRMRLRSDEREAIFDKQQNALRERVDAVETRPTRVGVGKPGEVAVEATAAQAPKETTKIQRLLQDAVGNLGEQRKDKPWWMWAREAENQTDPDAKERIYKSALEALPQSAELLGNFANLLYMRERIGEAEAFYERAIDADPKNAANLGNFALFLEKRERFEEAEASYKRAIDADPKHAVVLGYFADFLDKRERFEEAEASYKRAIDADPKHAVVLGYFAVFLEKRERFGEAETFYKRAIDADPKHANNLGNFARFLLASGRREEGLRLLEQAGSLPTSHDTLQVELAFYRFAHLAEQGPQSLKELRQLIERGCRSPGWNLKRNIQRAAQDGHPNVPLLEALAAVIAEGADPSTLDRFPEWQQAKAP